MLTRKSQVQLMAQHANKTSHLPTILGIGTTEIEPSHPVSRYNVSVLFSHFTAARSAIIAVTQSQNLEEFAEFMDCR